MNCLVLTPHRLGIKEVAERVGTEWEQMGHDVRYDLPDGAAARVGGVTVGVPGIARWWQKRFRELAGTDKYDLVWTHQPISPTVPDGAFWDATVVTFHTTERAEYRLAREGVYPWTRVPYLWVTSQLERSFYTRLESTVDAGPTYTVVSPHLNDETASFGVSDARYVPNGIARPDRTAFTPIRERLGIPPEATLAFSLGSHTPQKRPVECARVLNAVCEREESVHAVIAGDGPLHDDVRSAATSERVHVPGYVSDEQKWRWFADADVFVSLSAYEGMPVATLEALSVGTPAVLSEIHAHRNVIEQYDVDGALVDGSVTSVANAITSLAEKTTRVTVPTWNEVAEEYLTAVRA